MRLYDSLSREVRELRPMDGETYRFYCCGPTVYGPAHIGNFRTFVVQDSFRRTLELSSVPTKHVRNITDVDDKTIRRSQEEGQTLADFTNYWRQQFETDCAALNLLSPNVQPSAVEHIPHQIAMIEKLIQKGHAYQGEDGSVYFQVGSFPEYGRLSRLAEREIRLGSSQSANDSDEYEKESLADFALWKARKAEDGENFWVSPWGEGRPGWHLECSAMSLEYLGESFDLHSGGVDLIFPHHENEIAQSECCSGKTFARHWFHIAHLMVNGGKMSKSVGNFFTLADLKEKGHTPMELRYFYLSGHYRRPLNFTFRRDPLVFESLAAAKQALARLAKTEHALAKQSKMEGRPSYASLINVDPGIFSEAWESLMDDLNTPEALGKIFSALKDLDIDQLSVKEASAAYRNFHLLLAALGIDLPVVTDEGSHEIPESIRQRAEERWQARLARDWAKSDALRDDLAEAGWTVRDGKDSYTLSPNS